MLVFLVYCEYVKGSSSGSLPCSSAEGDESEAADTTERSPAVAGRHDLSTQRKSQPELTAGELLSEFMTSYFS